MVKLVKLVRLITVIVLILGFIDLFMDLSISLFVSRLPVDFTMYLNCIL